MKTPKCDAAHAPRHDGGVSVQPAMFRATWEPCGEAATVYAGGPLTGDWAGWYCDACAAALHDSRQFSIWNHVREELP